MIIKDTKGGKCRLTKTRLQEVTGAQFGINYYVLLSDLRKRGSQALLHRVGKKGYKPWIRIGPMKDDNIGCRTFSPETFAKILKAAGIKTGNKKAKKTVARKKGAKTR